MLAAAAAEPVTVPAAGFRVFSVGLVGDRGWRPTPGTETESAAAGADWFWNQVSQTERYLFPRNGAVFKLRERSLVP
jgi:hypothetical protein